MLSMPVSGPRPPVRRQVPFALIAAVTVAVTSGCAGTPPVGSDPQVAAPSASISTTPSRPSTSKPSNSVTTSSSLTFALQTSTPDLKDYSLEEIEGLTRFSGVVMEDSIAGNGIYLDLDGFDRDNGDNPSSPHTLVTPSLVEAYQVFDCPSGTSWKLTGSRGINMMNLEVLPAGSRVAVIREPKDPADPFAARITLLYQANEEGLPEGEDLSVTLARKGLVKPSRYHMPNFTSMRANENLPVSEYVDLARSDLSTVPAQFRNAWEKVIDAYEASYRDGTGIVTACEDYRRTK